jgi:uncharacterized protein (TIGR03435 family)
MMRKNDRDCAAIAAGSIAGERCGGQIFPGKVSALGMTMTQVVSGLARLMPNIGRPVVDRTGLTGTFDIDLRWTPDQPVANAMPGMAAATDRSERSVTFYRAAGTARIEARVAARRSGRAGDREGRATPA